MRSSHRRRHNDFENIVGYSRRRSSPRTSGTSTKSAMNGDLSRGSDEAAVPNPLKAPTAQKKQLQRHIRTRSMQEAADADPRSDDTVEPVSPQEKLVGDGDLRSPETRTPTERGHQDFPLVSRPPARAQGGL